MFSFMRSRLSVPEFWDRFANIKDQIKSAIERKDQPVALHLFYDLLKKYDDKLVCQVGVAEEGGLPEIEISADGRIDQFRSVIDLVDNAPAFPDFKISAFKQRLKELPAVGLNDTVEVSPAAIQYQCDFQGDVLRFDIWFDVPADVPEDMLYGLANIFLDCTLGEYDAVAFIGSVDVHHGHSATAQPWESLRAEFDAWLEKTHSQQ